MLELSNKENCPGTPKGFASRRHKKQRRYHLVRKITEESAALPYRRISALKPRPVEDFVPTLPFKDETGLRFWVL